ncbi:MAG: hypothetical protein M1838_004810 [Thelocarpon superellum]|nr:MAG: hypothetical protein M1838_004810 [Thelocarpon superellum]
MSALTLLPTEIWVAIIIETLPLRLEDLVHHPLTLTCSFHQKLLHDVVQHYGTLDYTLGKDECPRPANSWGDCDQEFGRNIHRVIFRYGPPRHEGDGSYIERPPVGEMCHYITCLVWPVRFQVLVIRAGPEWLGANWPLDQFKVFMRQGYRWKADEVEFEGWGNNAAAQDLARSILLRRGEHMDRRFNRVYHPIDTMPRLPHSLRATSLKDAANLLQINDGKSPRGPGGPSRDGSGPSSGMTQATAVQQ